jgi:FAD synthetase
MNHDSSVAQDGSPVNGAAKLPSASDGPRTLEQVAIDLRRKVLNLLELQTDDELLQNVQKQVRISMNVIEDSFERYQYKYGWSITCGQSSRSN